MWRIVGIILLLAACVAVVAVATDPSSPPNPGDGGAGSNSPRAGLPVAVDAQPLPAHARRLVETLPPEADQSVPGSGMARVRFCATPVMPDLPTPAFDVVSIDTPGT